MLMLKVVVVILLLQQQVNAFVFFNPFSRMFVSDFITPNPIYKTPKVWQRLIYDGKEQSIYSSKVKNIGWIYRGKKHRVTNIDYDQDGFPKFNAIFSSKLPLKKYCVSNTSQFYDATLQLKQTIARNPQLKEKFNKTQLSQINQVIPRIDGLVWHHSQKDGVLELVSRELHNKTPHTGGHAIWGCGKR
jgi:hypothetical protein